MESSSICVSLLTLKLYFANSLLCRILAPYILNKIGVTQKRVATEARITVAQFVPRLLYIGVPIRGNNPAKIALRNAKAAVADEVYIVYVSAK